VHLQADDYTTAKRNIPTNTNAPYIVKIVRNARKVRYSAYNDNVTPSSVVETYTFHG
jgi:hypothetical protein